MINSKLQKTKLLNSIKKKDHKHIIILATQDLEGETMDIESFNTNSEVDTMALLASYLHSKDLLEFFVNTVMQSQRPGEKNERKQSNLIRMVRQ